MRGWKSWHVFLGDSIVGGGVNDLMAPAVVGEGGDECLRELEEGRTFVDPRKSTGASWHADEPGVSHKSELPGVCSSFVDELVSSWGKSSECGELIWKRIEFRVGPEDVRWKWLAV